MWSGLAVKLGRGTTRKLVMVREPKLMESFRPRVHPDKCFPVLVDRATSVTLKTTAKGWLEALGRYFHGH